jgi:N-acetylglucosaminyldiphosphoundecaprenol N-acetyl-beta-D-mannosaminyltransferase
MDKRAFIFNAKVDCLTWGKTVSKITTWALKKEKRYICLINTHSLIESNTNKLLLDSLNNADLTLPDGFPIAKLIHNNFVKNQSRISGPDLMIKICKNASKMNIPIFLLGSTPLNLNYLKKELIASFQNIRIVGAISPKVDFNIKKNDRLCSIINKSNAQITFIGLGCPKQEVWMFQNSHKIQSVLIGVGGAFDINAKIIKRAPVFLQKIGLEWFYRLAQEPGRLLHRYFTTNSIFILKLVLYVFLRRPILSNKEII